MFERIERSAEFYAAGRVVYASDGEPVRFVTLSEVTEAARQVPGPILLLIRPQAAAWIAHSR